MQELENRSKVAHQQARLLNIKKRTNQKTVIIGNYRIGKKIGSGAYGAVHEAFHIETSEKFAAKIVYFTESNYEAVKNEVKISQRLCHENIVRVEEVIEAENKIFLIMEFCENGELFEFIRLKGPMNHDLAAKLFMQVYSAVKYLHFKKIAHRDIKTENILLDANMNAKLIDFGFSKEYSSEDPMMETFCGSPSYVSPEIIKKLKYNGEKIDVWSLGVTLYIMLEASEPFYGETTSDVKIRIANFHWTPSFHSSAEAKQLYELIFVPPAYRIGLSEMQNTPYFEKHFKLSQKKLRIESRSTQKTERTSTGENELTLLPNLAPVNNKSISKSRIRVSSEERKKLEITKNESTSLKKNSDFETKRIDASLKLNLKCTRDRFNWKTKSAEAKTTRSDFRVKATPTKPHKKQGALNIGFFKKEVTSSLHEY